MIKIIVGVCEYPYTNKQDVLPPVFVTPTDTHITHLQKPYRLPNLWSYTLIYYNDLITSLFGRERLGFKLRRLG